MSIFQGFVKNLMLFFFKNSSLAEHLSITTSENSNGCFQNFVWYVYSGVHLQHKHLYTY